MCGTSYPFWQDGSPSGETDTLEEDYMPIVRDPRRDLIEAIERLLAAGDEVARGSGPTIGDCWHEVERLIECLEDTVATESFEEGHAEGFAEGTQ